MRRLPSVTASLPSMLIACGVLISCTDSPSPTAPPTAETVGASVSLDASLNGVIYRPVILSDPGDSGLAFDINNQNVIGGVTGNWVPTVWHETYIETLVPNPLLHSWAVAVAVGEGGGVLAGFKNSLAYFFAIDGHIYDLRGHDFFPYLGDIRAVAPTGRRHIMNSDNLLAGQRLDGEWRASIFDHGTVRELPLPAGASSSTDIESVANAIDSNGRVAGYVIDHEALTTRAAVWSDETVELLPTPGPSSYAEDLNDYGDVVGWGWVETNDGAYFQHAFLWRDGELMELGSQIAASGLNTRAVAVNNRAQVLIQGLYTGELWLWEDGNLSRLEPPNCRANPYDLNASGAVLMQVLGGDGCRTGDRGAIVWRNGFSVRLPSPSGQTPEACAPRAMNDYGHVVGVCGETAAVLWLALAPVEAIEDLQDRVDDVAGLSPGQINGLSTQLSLATATLNAGREIAAARHLTIFQQQLNGLTQGDQISASTAQQLISEAQDIIDSLGT